MAWISLGRFPAPLMGFVLAFSSVAYAVAIEPIEFGTCPFPTPIQPEIITDLTFIASGQRLCANLNVFKTIEWDVKSGRIALPSHGFDGITAWSADNLLYAFCQSAHGQRVSLCQTANHKVIREFKPLSFLVSLLFTPDRQHILAADYSGRVLVWNLTSGETVAEFNVAPEKGRLLRLCMSPRDQTMAVVAIPSSAVWNWKTGQLVFELGEKVAGLAYDKDGSKLYGVFTDKLFAWSTVDYKKVLSMQSKEFKAYGVAVSPDGSQLALGGTGGVWLAHAETGEVIRTFPVVSLNFGVVAFSPDGKILAAGGKAPRVLVWDLQTGEPRMPTGHVGAVKAIAIDPGDKFFLSVGEDGALRRWDAQSAKLLNTIQLSEGCLNDVSLSPDGALAAVGGEDANVYICSSAR